MKKLLVSMVVVVVVILCLSNQGHSDISGTAHDFSASSFVDNGQICSPCHTPHGVSTGSFLWGHSPSSNDPDNAGAGWTVNLSGSTGIVDLTAGTKNCLSCHDGSIAVDDYVGRSGTSNGLTIFDIAAAAAVSTSVTTTDDITENHPIGVPYTYTGDPDYVDSDTVAGVLKLEEVATVRTVGCETCHDPHGVTGVPALLRVDTTGSAICLTCHVK